MNSTAHSGHSLADALFSRNLGRVADLSMILAGSLLIALLAQLSVPIGPVPISGQTLGVLLIGGALGARKAFWSVFAYVAEGAAGLPVFAGGRAGIAVLIGPTGGYLIGFVAAALIVGWLCEHGLVKRPLTAFAAMLAGSSVIYLFGTLWLARFTGWSLVLPSGVYPFLFGDALKAMIAALALPGAWAFLNRRADRKS